MTGARFSPGRAALKPLLLLALLFFPISTVAAEQPAFEQALQNARHAGYALRHAHAFLRHWTAYKDSRTALIAGGPDKNRWTVRGTATRIYPAMVRAAYLTDPPFFYGLLRETLRDETRLTDRLSGLPDDYDLAAGQFLHPTPDTERITAAAAEYAASGLLPIASRVGNDVWTDRLQQLVETIFARASVQTSYSDGPIPSESAETNGNLLRVLPWLALHTGNPKYLNWARRIADAYCLGMLPSNGGLPAQQWNFTTDRARTAALPLNHAGRVLIQGLAGLYAAEARLNPDRADIYRPTLAYMFNVLFTHARDPNGYFYARIEPDGRGGYTVDRKNRSTEWAHLLAAAAVFGKASGNHAYLEPARACLENLPQTYPRDWPNLPEALPGDLPGILLLLDQLEPQALASTRTWIDREFIAILTSETSPARVADSVLVEAALAYARAKTHAIRLHPWRGDLAFGARANADTLYLALASDAPWQGRLLFPQTDSIPVHTDETLRIASDRPYHLRIAGAGGSALWTGALLLNGLPVELTPEQPRYILLSQLPPPRTAARADTSDTSRPGP